jgi:hypothetical protein
MSIYCTLWEIKIPRRHCFDDQWVTVFAQAVPAHIGHPSEYPDGDLYASFLPPVVQEYDPVTGEAPFDRAVVIVQEGRDKKEGQRYTDPLIVMTGEEYARTPFDELLNRIHKAIGWDESVVALAYLPSGQKKIIRHSREAKKEEDVGDA